MNHRAPSPADLQEIEDAACSEGPSALGVALLLVTVFVAGMCLGGYLTWIG